MADKSITQTIKDAEVDARSLSEFISKNASFMVTRRLAPTIHTLDYYLNNFDNVVAKADDIISGTQDRANNAINQITADGTAQIAIAISNAGFIPVGTFAGGATLSKPNDVLKASDGKLYRWAGSLPKTVSSGSTPESTGGFGSNAWLEVSDASLSQKLSGLGGASTIGSGVSVFNNMAEFLAAESQIQDGSKVFLHSFYQGLDLEGEGRLYTYSKTDPKAVSHETASGFLSRDFDGKVFIAEYGATGGDITDVSSRTVDSEALQSCFDVIRSNGYGVLSMGIMCSYHATGVIIAEVSNFVWEFNQSTLYIGQLAISWQPNDYGYGNYKNVTIRNATIVGNIDMLPTASGVAVTGGFLQMDMAKIDGVYVRNNKFIECMLAGHVLDLMGSRYVYFEHNEVLGTAAAIDYDRVFSEVVQLSTAVPISSGTPIREGRTKFFDGASTSNVYVRDNIFNSYINPITGEKSYSARPMGEHGFRYSSKVYFEGNHVEDVKLQNVRTVNYAKGCVTAVGLDSHFNDNTFIMTNGNAVAIEIFGVNDMAVDRGYKPHYEIKNNRIITKNVTTLSEEIYALIWFEYTYSSGLTDDLLGFDLVVSGNSFDVDATGHAGVFESIFHVNTNVKNANIAVENNSFDIKGAPQSMVRLSRAVGYDRNGGKYRVINNIFKGVTKEFSVVLSSAVITSESNITYEIKGNTFYDSYRVAYMITGSHVIFSNNIIHGWKLRATPDGGVSPNLIQLNRAHIAVSNNNILVLPSEEVYTAAGEDYTSRQKPVVTIEDYNLPFEDGFTVFTTSRLSLI